MNPSKKLQVYIYTLIIAVLRLQLTVDRNEELLKLGFRTGEAITL